MQTAETSAVPPDPKRPVQLRGAYKTELRTALKSFALMVRPWAPAQVEHTFNFIFSLAGPVVKDHFDEFCRSENAPRLLAEQPDLVAVLNDRQALARMPEGSFGRAYLDYISCADMATADYFNQAADIASCARRFGWDEDVVWFMERQAALHDLFHVLSGYDQSGMGEVGVIAFTGGQYPYPVVLAPTMLFAMGPAKFRPVRWYRYLRGAYLHGKNAKPIGWADLERLLPAQLSEVRAQLNIAAMSEVHPEGMPNRGRLYRFIEDFTIKSNS